MSSQELNGLVNYIVNQGLLAIQKSIEEKINFPVDYVAVFSKDKKENNELLELLKILGKVVEKTSTGITFKLTTPIATNAGKLHLIKIRKFDPIKQQRGAPDFVADDYELLKDKYLHRKNFQLLQRENYEMLELANPEFDVLVYFPNPPLSKDLLLLS